MSNLIDKPIIAYKVLTEEVVPLLEPVTLERDEVLIGTTYKTKILDHNYYITINDIVINNTARPYEIFINTKNVENFTKLLTYCRLISAFFRTGHSYSFIAKELEEIIDPSGGYFKKGRRYESLEAELGEILRKHFENLNKV